MEEEPIEAYNSDSGEGEFQMDNITDEESAKGANFDGEPGSMNWI
jgi:hypothetical protein